MGSAFKHSRLRRSEIRFSLLVCLWTKNLVSRIFIVTIHLAHKETDLLNTQLLLLNLCFCHHVNSNHALPSLRSSLHSFLWKLLLAQLWICLAALLLTPHHNTSLGAVEKLLYSDMRAENRQVKGKRMSLHTTCQLVWRILIHPGQCGLQKQRQSLVWGRDTHFSLMMQRNIHRPDDHLDWMPVWSWKVIKEFCVSCGSEWYYNFNRNLSLIYGFYN